MPDHSNVAGNGVVYELSRKGTLESVSWIKQGMGVCLPTWGLSNRWVLCQNSEGNAKTRACATADTFRLRLDGRRLSDFLKLTKQQLPILVGVLIRRAGINISPDLNAAAC